ncbi:MAG: ASKHA domain-containing protein [bacterium]
MSRTVTATFQPSGKSIEVPVGTRLQDALSQAGIDLDHPCGGHGICEKCQVDISGRVSPPTDVERDLFGPDEFDRGRRLSCQVEILGPVEVTTSQGGTRVEIILQEGQEPSYEVEPPVHAFHLSLTRPSVEDQRGDEERVLEALQALGEDPEPMPPRILRLLPGLLRESDWSITAILHDRQWVAVQPGNTADRLYGVAVDLGTTTVVASLHDLRDGRELGKRGMTNKQVVCGSDVISRMTCLNASDAGLKTLHEHAVHTINQLIDELSRDCAVRREEIVALSLVGNTIMQQLFLNVDPTPIGASPFTPAFQRPTVWSAQELGVRIHPDGCVCVAPVIAGYVGGDIVADILASAVYESDETILLVDLGTNAEITLINRDRISSCACAAGPAFEGGEISQGMRAVEGAIERVRIKGEDLGLGVIGDVDPVGICGSGLVDALAVLLDTGAVDKGGRLLPPGEYTGPEWVRKRLRTTSDGISFVLWEKGKKAVTLSGKDIREIQLAKGAVKAGIKILCHERNGSVDMIAKILIAGAFGSHLQPESALKTGLIPRLDPKKVHFVGNTAWVGAKMLLLSALAARRARGVVGQTQYIELSGRPDFQSEFGLSMAFDDAWEYVGSV